MKVSTVILLVALASWFAVRESQAQRHGQKSDRPRAAVPAHQPAPPVAPVMTARPAPARFRDLAVNSTFFFLSDTNHAYPWIKVSNTAARNTVNTNEATISPQTPISH